MSENSKFNQFLKEIDGLSYRTYGGEYQIDEIMNIMNQELSEPYPIFTYRYFLNLWPEYNILVFDKEKFIGCIIANAELKKSKKLKGYIAMIAVDKSYRGRKIGKNLVQIYLEKLKLNQANEVYLETEVTNTSALGLYESKSFNLIRSWIY